MKFAPALARGRLVRRYKRFLADVETADGVVTMHCPNTGAMTGCSDPGSEVWYSMSANPARKYPHTLEVVCTPAGRVGVNTARANSLVAEALEQGQVTELAGYPVQRREAAIPGGHGRFDFLLEAGERRCWVEVKSLTLHTGGGRGAFPDAVSARAAKHVQALSQRRADGDRAVLLFCVQHTGVRVASPADEIDPAYAAVLRQAAGDGVEVLAYRCRIQRAAMTLTTPLAVCL